MLTSSGSSTSPTILLISTRIISSVGAVAFAERAERAESERWVAVSLGDVFRDVTGTVHQREYRGNMWYPPSAPRLVSNTPHFLPFKDFNACEFLTKESISASDMCSRAWLGISDLNMRFSS